MNEASCHDVCMIASPQAPRPSASARAASAEVGRQEQLRSVGMVWMPLVQPDYHVPDQWNLVNCCFFVWGWKDLHLSFQNTWVEFEIHKTYKLKCSITSITCRLYKTSITSITKRQFSPSRISFSSGLPHMFKVELTLHRSLENLPSGRAMFGPPWLMHLRLDRLHRWFQLFTRTYCFAYWILNSCI